MISSVVACLMKQDYRVIWINLQSKAQNSSFHLSTGSGIYLAKLLRTAQAEWRFCLDLQASVAMLFVFSLFFLFLREGYYCKLHYYCYLVCCPD